MASEDDDDVVPDMDVPTQLCPVGVIAKLFGLTPRRVQQLVKAEYIPKAARGKYDLTASIQGYIRFLKEQNERAGGGSAGGDGSAPDWQEERGWVYRHRREDLAINVATKAGVVVFREDAVKALMEQAKSVRAGIDGTESAIADELAGRVWTTREIAEVVRRQHRQAMKRFSIADGVEPNLVRKKLPEGWEDEEDVIEDRDPSGP